ncbi:hypothetical protein [Dokdonella koreensis]|uniref:Uncharacterized protein n=1 Tax=Dokdonella koreensis DS-123 TaxID=1300342 RepID=A0A167GU33_9GAMM|nr:hypothetical protein [Dokdonella koreensis]ANB17626.1 Hypothetical protein I596_1602 [Dokdonella koreensis DS-123]
MSDLPATVEDPPVEVQWWLAVHGDTLIWARLSVLDSGIAEVFDCDGRILRYDDEPSARMALLDAEFRAFDGVDEDDAALLGVDLDATEPPQAEHDEDLVPQMIVKRVGHA